VKIRHLYLSSGHNFFGHHGQPAGDSPTLEVAEVECVAGQGLVGDRFFAYKENYQGQITFLAAEVFAEVCQKLGVVDKSPGVMRRNVVTEGVDLNTLIGQEFTVQGVTFAGVGECSPCHWMDDAIAPGAEAGLQGRGGLRARILTSGKLRVEV